MHSFSDFSERKSGMFIYLFLFFISIMKRFWFIVLVSVMVVVCSSAVISVAAPVEIGSFTSNTGFSQNCGAAKKSSSEIWTELGATKLCYEGYVYICGSTTVGKRYVDANAFGAFCSLEKGKYVWQVCGEDSEVEKFSSSVGLGTVTIASNNQQVSDYTCKKKGYTSEYWVETKSIPLFQGNCGELDNYEVSSSSSEMVLCSMGMKYTCDSSSVGKVTQLIGVSLLCSSSHSWQACGKHSFGGSVGINTFAKGEVSYVGEGGSYQGYYCDDVKWEKTKMYELAGTPTTMRVKHTKSNAMICSAGSNIEICSTPTFTKENSDYFTLDSKDVSYYWTRLRLHEVSGGFVIIELPSSTTGGFLATGIMGEGMMTLCSSPAADSGYVQGCSGIRDDVSLSSLWKEVDLGNGQFTLEHVKSGQFLCGSSSGKADDMLGKCGNKNRDDAEWSTKFVRADENCENAVDDDKDGLVDCSDDMCYTYSSCEKLWIGMWNVLHPRSLQYLCGSNEGGVEMCGSANRKEDDTWQALWKVVLKSTGVRNFVMLEDVHHIKKVAFKGIGKALYEDFQRMLCSANSKQDDTVNACVEVQEIGRSAMYRLLFEPVVVSVKMSDTTDASTGGRGESVGSRGTSTSAGVTQKWEVRFEHRRSGDYLCGESVKGKYGVEMCKNQDRDDMEWSTRWQLIGVVNEDCGNGKDDDLNGKVDCEDSTCVQDVKCKVVCKNGVKCGGAAAKGLLDEVVCGMDFQHYRCSASGWMGQGDNCKPCPYPEVLCNNHADDDLDGLQDCKDSDCFADELCKNKLCSGCQDDCLLKKDKKGVDKWTCVECESDLNCYGGKKCIDYTCGFPVDANAVTCVDSDVANDVHVKGAVTLLQKGKVLSSEEDSCVKVDEVQEKYCLQEEKLLIDFVQQKCAKGEYCLDGRCQLGLVLGEFGGKCDEKTVCPDGSVCAEVKGKPELGKICLGGGGGSCASSLFCAPGFVCKNNKCTDVTKFAGEAICDDGVDNDKDGKIDCVDSDCDDETNVKGFVCCSDEANSGKVDATPCSVGTMCDDSGFSSTYQCMECISGEKECTKGSCVKGKCVFCDDPDGDKGYGVKSVVKVGGVSAEDVCVDANVLKEYFCIGEISAVGLEVTEEINFKDFIDADEVDCAQQSGKCVDGKCVGKNFCANTYETVGKKVGKDKSIVEKFLTLFTKGKYAGCLKGDFNNDGVIDADDSTDYVLAFRKAGKEKVVDEKANLDESEDNKIDASDTTDYVLAFRNYGKLKK